jgi:hypothetical protein
MGTTQISELVLGSMLIYIRKRPSADQLVGVKVWSVVRNGSSAPAPFVSF